MGINQIKKTLKESTCSQTKRYYLELSRHNSQKTEKQIKNDIIKLIIRPLRTTNSKIFDFFGWNCRNLTIIDIKTDISCMGFKLLSRISLPKLKQLTIDQPFIKEAVLLHLSKTRWSQLESLTINLQELQSRELKWLCKGNWKKIKDAYIGLHIFSSSNSISNSIHMTELVPFNSTNITIHAVFTDVTKDNNDLNPKKWMNEKFREVYISS